MAIEKSEFTWDEPPPMPFLTFGSDAGQNRTRFAVFSRVTDPSFDTLLTSLGLSVWRRGMRRIASVVYSKWKLNAKFTLHAFT